ncbi:phosphonate C-P lyase system protein PhnG [Rhodovulum tesquicola]|uniref:phosphonate C-P lyase system protein PhnG n=1 Tax=Rhodovulum tesquicola TaxID=540254 RepID=UPI0020978D5E|nr:phosphonate C-P lyase system protein PhnG [Rhodovulum tesquicola]MCO8146083.1 phosphonate C-P lyase system protein PhnG [Rhodovulum tesquicola]
MSAPLPTRAEAMGLLARARPETLAELAPDLPGHTMLRAPETGAVMVQGRQGGTGAPFNLGEMTVTRCAVRLECGAIGHAWVQGRDKGHARRAAVLDALLQTDRAAELAAAILAPLAAAEAASHEAQSRRAGATRVEFFTMVRGEDE